MYPRPDGTVYMCGYTDDEPLPETADLVKASEKALRGLQDMGKYISSELEGLLSMGSGCLAIKSLY